PRALPCQHLSGRADVSFCREERTERHMGHRDRIRECVSLRLERAARRRGQRYSRAQRSQESARNAQWKELKIARSSERLLLLFVRFQRPIALCDSEIDSPSCMLLRESV